MSDHQDKKKNLLDKMETRLRNEPVIAVILLLSAVIIGTSEVVQHGSELLADTGIREEKTLSLAKDNAKEDLSRRLTELAWRRLFWTGNYVEKVRLKRPQVELDYSWNKHLDTVADWSSDFMVNLNGMEKFYPHGSKAADFQAIHEKFRDIEGKVVALRTIDAADQDNAIANLKLAIDDVNTALYWFVLNRQPPK
jgi:hypothetical protein